MEDSDQSDDDLFFDSASEDEDSKGQLNVYSNRKGM